LYTTAIFLQVSCTRDKKIYYWFLFLFFLFKIAYDIKYLESEFLKFIGPSGQKIMRSANNVGNAGPHVRQTFFINPAVSEANMVDTCKHFEIGSGSVRSLSHLPVFVIEHLWRDQHETNKIK
jgi:hypothetical protein